MQEKRQGGKRIGAGRKPLPVTQKKTALTLYPSNADMYKFGNKEKMQEEILKFIADYGVKAAIQDLNQQTAVIKPFEQPKTNYQVNTQPIVTQPLVTKFEAFKARVLKTSTILEVEAVMKEVKAEVFLTVGEKKTLEVIAKEHSKNMYND